MNANVLFLAMAAAAVSATKEDHWAVLISGSSGFSEYDQQALTCRAYQTLKRSGVPENQIIHLAVDDIAGHPKNPFPGKLFNAPTAEGVEGDDVYAGCKIDYKGRAVNKENLLKVLKGDKTANGPVLGSGPNSRVFFYYADHGGWGFVCMPRGGRLLANELHETFKYMHDNNMYKELVHYMEACHSGSMFEGILEENLNIYVHTSCEKRECALKSHCPPDDMVNGQHIGTCLGGLWDNAWLDDADKADMSKETLQEQYDAVRKVVKDGCPEKHHFWPQQYGQLNLTEQSIGNFMSGGSALVAGNKKRSKKVSSAAVTSTVSYRDGKLNLHYNDVMRDPTPENHKALSDEVAKRMKADKVFAEAFPTFNFNSAPSPSRINFDCYAKLMDQFEKVCFMFDDYSVKYAGYLAQQCDVIAANTEAWGATIATLTKTCSTI